MDRLSCVACALDCCLYYLKFSPVVGCHILV